MMRLLALLMLQLAAILIVPVATAHEVRPAYLEISQSEAGACRITWKQPTMGDVAVRLVPHISNGWLERSADDQYAAAGFMIRTWTVSPCAVQTLAGSTISIEGLQNTITDALVRIQLSNGQRIEAIVRPESPQLVVPLGSPGGFTVPAHVLLGIEHILAGADHLLFVLGLLLLVRDRWTLVKAVSAFTVGHSLSLGFATLGKLSLPGPYVETLIALSIVFLAAEVLRARKGGTSLTVRHPWAVAFVFGLFHGMGFAGALTDLGYAGQDLVFALVFFNLGVEIGQVAFIAVVLLLGRALAAITATRPSLVPKAAAYLVGISGACWTLQTGTALVGMS